MGALAQLAAQALAVYGLGEVAGSMAERAGYGPAPSLIPGFGGTGGGWGFGAAKVKRHRRRKALTNDDMRLALSIASAIGKKAAETFILQRVRSG